jgi:hypothetical protein
VVVEIGFEWTETVDVGYQRIEIVTRLIRIYDRYRRLRCAGPHGLDRLADHRQRGARVCGSHVGKRKPAGYRCLRQAFDRFHDHRRGRVDYVFGADGGQRVDSAAAHRDAFGMPR